jgi:hypothetical protein
MLAQVDTIALTCNTSTGILTSESLRSGFEARPTQNSVSYWSDLSPLSPRSAMNNLNLVGLPGHHLKWFWRAMIA